MRFLSVFMILIIVMAFAPGSSIQLDGVIGDAEWKNAKEYKLSGGRKLLFKKEDKDLYVAMAGTKQTWAHVYLYYADTIHVLHASAALGEAKYIKQRDI